MSKIHKLKLSSCYSTCVIHTSGLNCRCPAVYDKLSARNCCATDECSNALCWNTTIIQGAICKLFPRFISRVQKPDIIIFPGYDNISRTTVLCLTVEKKRLSNSNNMVWGLNCEIWKKEIRPSSATNLVHIFHTHLNKALLPSTWLSAFDLFPINLLSMLLPQSIKRRNNCQKVELLVSLKHLCSGTVFQNKQYNYVRRTMFWHQTFK